MNQSVDVGNVSEAKALAAFVEAGYLISKPFGDGHCYDLVVDDGQRLLRVQVKTGRLKKGAVVFWPRSNNGRWYKTGGYRFYEGKVDLIAVYCPETDQVYVLPAVGSHHMLTLRVEPSRNNQQKGIRLADDYKLRSLREEIAEQMKSSDSM